MPKTIRKDLVHVCHVCNCDTVHNVLHNLFLISNGQIILDLNCAVPIMQQSKGNIWERGVEESMQGHPKINKWLTPLASPALVLPVWTPPLVLVLVLIFFFFFLIICFSSAGVQPVCAREQKASRVEEKGCRPAHREANLQWLLASGETFYDWSLDAAPCVCLNGKLLPGNIFLIASFITVWKLQK